MTNPIQAAATKELVLQFFYDNDFIPDPNPDDYNDEQVQRMLRFLRAGQQLTALITDEAPPALPAPPEAPAITALQRALMGTTLSLAERDAVYSCVCVGYEGCPDDIAAVMEPLMRAETGTRADRLHAAGIGGLGQDDLGRALDEARERTGCPYLACKQGKKPDTMRICMMVGTDGGLGTLMLSFTADLTEEETKETLRSLDRAACVAHLVSLALAAEDRGEPTVRRVYSACADCVRNGTVKG